MDSLVKVHFQQAFSLNGEISEDYDGVSYNFKKKCREYGFDINVDKTFSGMPESVPKEIPRLQMLGENNCIRLVISPVRADLAIDFMGMNRDFDNEIVKALSLFLYSIMAEVGIVADKVGNVIQHIYKVDDPVGFIKGKLLSKTNKKISGVNSFVGVKFFEDNVFSGSVNISAFTEIENAQTVNDNFKVISIKKDINNFNIESFDLSESFEDFIVYCLAENEEDVIQNIFEAEV